MILCKIYFLIMCCLLTYISAQNYNKTKEQLNELINNHQFIFGVSSSAFQIEGAWKESGKGESIWDRFTHDHPEKIADASNADISCDSYHNIERDIEMLKYLGVHFYRFSISWSRISHTPMNNVPNPEGLKYYHNLIDKLKANNIKPIVTLYHYDLPQNIQDFGGWTNELVIEYFENYARIIFDNFASKVNIWVTFNEPDNVCHHHYGTDEWPPEISSSGIADYLCLRNLFLAHARVFHLYKTKYDKKNYGMMGLNLAFKWFEPLSNSTEDIEATETFRKLFYGIHADPVYSSYGDFPDILKTVIANKSKEQGFHNSRLPEFTIAEIEYIRNTYDFMGISYYTPFQIPRNPVKSYEVPSFEDDLGAYDPIYDEAWTNTSIEWIKNYPEGLKNSLLYIKNTYNNPTVMILENGCGTPNSTSKNHDCVVYFEEHLEAVYDAVKKGCNVHGYGVWSLMDSFEWDKGYTEHFGLFHADSSNQTQSIVPKDTAQFFKEILHELEFEPKDNNTNKPPDGENINGSDDLPCLSTLILILFTLFLRQY